MKKYLANYILASLFLLTGGCVEENICENIIEEDVSLEDMVAFVDPNNTIEGIGEMYIDEEHKERIIQEFGAIELEEDLFYMEVETVEGTFVEFQFRTVPVERPYQFVTEESPDELLSKYKLYRNAKCKEKIGTIVDTCQKIGDRYLIYEAIGWNECKKGNDFCVEIERVVSVKKWYEDNQCEVLIEIENTKLFSCTK